jgi:hypothetical protein
MEKETLFMATAADLRALERQKTFTQKVALAEAICGEESDKLFQEEGVKFKFLEFDGEVKLLFVEQVTPLDTRLTHDMLIPLRKRLRTECNKRWSTGIKTKMSLWEGRPAR